MVEYMERLSAAENAVCAAKIIYFTKMEANTCVTVQCGSSAWEIRNSGGNLSGSRICLNKNTHAHTSSQFSGGSKMDGSEALTGLDCFARAFHAHLCRKSCVWSFLFTSDLSNSVWRLFFERITGEQKRIKPVKFFEAGCCSRFFSLFFFFCFFPTESYSLSFPNHSIKNFGRRRKKEREKTIHTHTKQKYKI